MLTPVFAVATLFIGVPAVQCDLSPSPEAGSITVCSTAPMRAVAPGQVSLEMTTDKDEHGVTMCKTSSTVLCQ